MVGQKTPKPRLSSGVVMRSAYFKFKYLYLFPEKRKSQKQLSYSLPQTQKAENTREFCR